MKRNFLIFLLIISAFFYAYGQNNSPIDLVLLLDTSQGMSSSYDNVNNYITGPFLREFLRVGDTFHLITFSANQRLDSARIIYGIGDIETIIARMLIQYPVENGSNVANALTFTERYVTSLPPRSKKIVLITTGGPDTNTLITASKQRISSKNVTLDYIQVTPGRPLSNLPKSNRPDAKATAANANPTPSTTVVTSPPPSQTGTTAQTGTSAGTSGKETTSGTSTASDANKSSGTNATSAESSTSGTNSTAGTGTASTEGTSSTTETVSGGTEQVTTDASVSQTTPSGDNDTSVSDNTDTSGTSNVTSKGKEKDESSLASILLIVIIAVVILGLIAYFASRRLGSSPNRVMAKVSSSEPKEDKTRFKDHSKDLASYAAGQSRRSTPYENRPVKLDKDKQPVINPSGPLLLNLFVDDQNTEIGKRNVHSLKSGYSLSVGGGNADDFLIFLVPMPSRIGEVRRNGSSLTFIPQKPKYFPDIGSNEVKDCINKTIRVVSDKNYEMRFRFEMYEDPLVALNRMLMSVKVPG